MDRSLPFEIVPALEAVGGFLLLHNLERDPLVSRASRPDVEQLRGRARPLSPETGVGSDSVLVTKFLGDRYFARL